MRCIGPILACCLWAAQAPAQPVAVRLDKQGEQWRLLRDGKPYFIKGAGGGGPKATLASTGGNGFRTWGADTLDKELDEAQRLGLTVAAGIWIGHERHGFKYNDPEQVARLQEMVRDVVQKHKDHPALLLWSIGNEMEGSGDNAAVWLALNNLAVMVKKLDPHHPVMTVIAEVPENKVRNLHRLCPDIDIVGINSYAGAASVAERYARAGGTKPYVLTEFGPPGTWEVGKTAWGAIVEPTSTAKAEWYARAWEKAVASQPLCLGGYAFTWGHKQEATATWFGMLLPSGERLGAVDVLTHAWKGAWPPNRCPEVKSIAVDGPADVEPGATVRVKLSASDPEGDPITVQWVLQSESPRYFTGGDAEAAPPTFPAAIVRESAAGAEVKLPDAPGPYRLFAYVRDGKGGAATANVPLRVKGEAKVVAPPKAALPFVVYQDRSNAPSVYIPAGWMGNAAAVKLDEACTDNPAAGKTCIRCEYAASGDWAGVVWQSPEGDWGDQPGGRDLTGAKRLTFRARGAKGDEVVTFLFGLIKPDKPYHDTARAELANVKLTDAWQTYTIDLAGKDLSRVKTAFAWTVAGQGRPIVFYLDEIRYE